jgi:hypothetical protein
VPQVTATPATVYLHCRDARCSGYNQQEVAGYREESVQTFGENGGDGIFTNFPERSIVSFHAAGEKDELAGIVACPGCGQSREVSGDPRPQYQAMSGHDPMGLVGGIQFSPNQVSTVQDAELAELKAQVAKLAAALGEKED